MSFLKRLNVRDRDAYANDFAKEVNVAFSTVNRWENGKANESHRNEEHKGILP